MIIGIIFIALTLLSLIAGLVLMATGGKINKKYSKKLMTARVILQFCAIFSLFILFILGGKS